MKAAIFAYSKRGCETALKVKNSLSMPSVGLFTIEKFIRTGFELIEKGSFFEDCFNDNDALIFISSAGIAVRHIAPFVKDKTTDPAVLCIDEKGTYVIPLLSGHIGGANDLARELSESIGAEAVITTATDINHRFSVDSWAARNGLIIDSMKYAKAVSAAILERDIPLCSDFYITGGLPQGIYKREKGELGILISYEKREPFEQTLRLIPKVLHIGIGCRKGISKEAVKAAAEQVLEEHNIDIRAIKNASSMDIKASESGLLEYIKEQGWPMTFYSAEELMKVQGDFSSSEFVKSITGVDNVCERSALMNADRLIVKKTALNGVTIALAAEDMEVRFG